jgi:putative FmdB family regulatory protein
MVIYQYRCTHCGDVEVRRPMGGATTRTDCPNCGDTDARRVFTSPRTRLMNPTLVQALDHAGATSERPEVVTKLPPKRSRPSPRPRHPLHARLPRL